MLHRRLLTALLILSTHAVLAAEPEAPPTPPPVATPADTNAAPATGAKASQGQDTDSEKPAEAPPAEASDPGCD
ncbi:MAG: hypothetical protein ABR553_03760 [Gammaproteobacteria bacterium]